MEKLRGSPESNNALSRVLCLIWSPEHVAAVANRAGLAVSRGGANWVLRSLDDEYDPGHGVSETDVLVQLRRLPRNRIRLISKKESKLRPPPILTWFHRDRT